MSTTVIEHDRREAKLSVPFLRFGVAQVKGAGPMMLAVSDEGLCWTGMTDKTAKLRKAFPHAVLLRDDKLAAKLAREMAAVWQGRAKKISVPLVLVGSDFERAVWLRLLRIKKGKTASYGDIAREIGSPGAVRAVGTAVGKNPLTLIIPCHRVLAQSKAAQMKFGWGPKAKKMLLDAEGAVL